jgi:hypothetical protein
VRPGVTNAEIAAPEVAWRCESFPLTSSSASLEVCLTAPTLRPIAVSHGTSSTSSVVFPGFVAADERTAEGFRSG